MTLDYPSRLADDLKAGRLDVALWFRRSKCCGTPTTKIISDACVATRGPVMSVKLYSRVPFGEIQSLALDEGSRTSVALARVMLNERFGVVPRLEPLPFECTAELGRRPTPCC